MLQFIPDWSQVLGRKTSRPRRRSGASDSRFRRAAFETLEQRRLLAINYVNVANSLDTQLLAMNGRITTALNGFQSGLTSKIPIVGDKLGNAAQVVAQFNNQLKTGLSDLGTNASPTDAQIQSSLAAQLTDFLGGAGANGVHITHNGSTTSIEMLLQHSIGVASASVGFNTGLPSLPIELSATGTIDVSIGFALDLKFTIDASGGVNLNNTTSINGATAPDANHPIVNFNNPLAIFVSATPSAGFHADATFGFVAGTAAPIGGSPNGLYATALVSSLTSTPTIKLDGSADANLRLTGSFAGTGDDFPGISTDFHLHWSLSSSAPAAGAPTVSFDNVSLNFGRFISNVLSPVFHDIKDATDQLKPVIDFLTTKVPGITDLSELAGAGPITVGDLASLASQVTGAGPLADLVNKVVGVLDKIDSLSLGPTISMPLGGFDLDSPSNGDLRSAAIAGDLSNLDIASLTSFAAAHIQEAAQSYHDFINGLGVSQDVKDTLNGLVAIPNNGFQIAFPILDDPAAAVFNMILGRDSDLFYLKADADVHLEGSQATGLSIFGQGIDYVGEVDFKTHLKFAYDTFGVRELINHIAVGDLSDVFSDITDGFYIKSDSYARVAGRIAAEAGVSAGIFDAVISGGLSTPNNGNDPVTVQIIDPNQDGKLRISEFNNDKAFITSGSVDAGLGVELRIGKEILGKFIGIKKRYDIAHEVILQFADPTPPVLASQPDASGSITLYLGQNANLRTGLGLDQIDGDESFTIRHVADNPAGGEDIKISAFGVTQTVNNVRSINATDGIGTLTINVLPGVTSNVHFVGGQGAATLTYRGTGDADLHGGVLASDLTGGAGANVLVGGAGDDTIVLGSGSNNVTGGGGHNTIVVEAPILQNSVVSGGTGPNNSLQILGSPNTVAISAVPSGGVIDVGIQNVLELPIVHLMIGNIGDVFVSAQDSNTNFTLGDLAAVGVHDLTLNIVASFSTARTIDLDTHIGNAPSTVAVHDLVNQYEDPQHAGVTITEHGATIANSTTGLTTVMLGFSAADTMTLRHHGGSLGFDALAFTSGHFVLDTAVRNAGQADAISITLASRDNPTITMSNDAGNVLLTMTTHASFKILGSAALDSVSLYVEAAHSGVNTMSIDASSLHGQLKIYMLGDGTAVDHLTFSKAASDTDAYIYGQNTTTDLMFGTGQLALIQHNAYASNVQLTVDNDQAAVGSYLKLTATTFGNWLIPALGTSAQLSFAGLRSGMEVFAAAGDRFQLDVTPPNITSLTMHNESDLVQDVVYTANWVVPLALIGNFAFFAGRTLNEDGTFNRIKRLVNIHSAVTLSFHGNAPSQVILDGDADAPGAEYTLGGNGGLAIANTTVGLSVTIGGYRDVDTLYVYMPGAHMVADLQRTSPGKIYFDGQARLSGTNPTAINNISIKDRYGSTQLTPLSTYNSLLDNFNDVYLLGSMPQDALAVSVPTNVVINVGQASQLNLAINPDGYATVGGWDGTSLISWMSGTRPNGFFVFGNVDAASWDSYFAPGSGHGTPPNPFIEQPYGIVMPHVDAPLSVTMWHYEIINGVRTLLHETYSGTGRYWTVNQNPVAVNNDVQLNASQLRGTFNFNVTGPDYDYIRYITREGLFSATQPSVSYNAPFYTWGSAYNLGRIAFGQSNIALTDVNPQLAVSVDSANKNYTYPELTWVNLNSEVVRSAYPATSLNIGGGRLANIQGNVTAQNVILTVDDSLGTSVNNLIMTPTSLGTWTTASGTTNPVITLGTLDNRAFTVLAGTLDRIGIEGVPLTASLTSIKTANNTTAPVNVYLMGRGATKAVEAVGNINLFVGRRLNADGTVTKVGNVAGVLGPNSLTVPISYQFTGTNGHGQLTYDASNFTFGAGDTGQMSIVPVASDPTKEYLYFNNSVNYLLFGSNIDVEYDEPVLSNVRAFIDQRLNGAIRYVANSQGPAGIVTVTTAYGPVQVDGRGLNTRVIVTPVDTPTISRELYNPAGKDLTATILAPIMVTNAKLEVRPDTTTTPAPAQPKNVVITASQITGIAGAAIQYSNLVESAVSGYTPGLMVQLPRFSANLTVTGSPAGVTTGLSVIGQTMLNTQITGASGRLALGTFADSGTYAMRDNGQDFGFTTQSLAIGSGSTQSILGEVLLGKTGRFSSASGVIIDDRNDTTSRDVTFKSAPATGIPTITGLSAGSIGMSQVPGGLTVYSPAASHWTMQGIESLGPAIMYAGLGTALDLAGPVNTFANPIVIPRWQILGAGTVRMNPGSGGAKVSNAQFPIIKADPARPTDITQLIVDHTNVNAVYFDDNSVPAGIVNYLQVLDKAPDGFGRISLGSSTNLQTEVEYQLATTQLTLTGGRISSEQMNVLDTGPLTTTIKPNFSQVNVLGTTGPLEIWQPTSGSSAKAFLGNAGNMQGIHGEITLRGDNAALPTLQATLDMSAESLDYTVAIANLSATQTEISGIAPTAIHLVGGLITTSLKGGSGNNTLVGPDAANAWVINAANGGTLNSTKYSFSGFRNLTGGNAADTFRFTTTGLLAGNLDGGPGVDTLTYDNAATWHTLPYDLAHGIAPLVGGTASHLEIVPTAGTSAGNQTSYFGDVVSLAPLSILGGLGNFTFTATGLPAGLSINPTTGLVTGTVPAQTPGAKAVHISATDGFNPQSADFTWTVQAFALANPGSLRSRPGDTINQQIQVLGHPGALTFSAVGLPAGLSIDPVSGLISGTVQTPSASGSFAPTISATDGQNSASVSFSWLVPTFALANPGNQTIPEGVSVNIPIMAYNIDPSSFINFTASGMPPGLYVNGDSLAGNIAYSLNFASYDITINAQRGSDSDSIHFTISTLPGFGLGGIYDRRNYDNKPIDDQLSLDSPYGHQLSVVVSGLPDGLSIDSQLHITGSFTSAAVSATPHHVSVTVTNETLNYTYTTGFDWTVSHLPTVAELNAGTSAGVPFLAAVFDPDSSFPDSYHGVTYGSGASAHSIIYFVNNSQLWQYDGQQATLVASCDPSHPTMPTSVGTYSVIAGRGILFADFGSGLWFADEAGGRVIYSDAARYFPSDVSAAVGDVAFVAGQKLVPNGEGFDYSYSVLSITFGASGDPVVNEIFNSPNYVDDRSLTAFGGGVAFVAGAPADGANSLYWYDSAAHQLHTLLSSSSISSLQYLTAVDAGDGTQNLFFIENSAGLAILNKLNSSQLSVANPRIDYLEAFDSVGYPLVAVDGQVLIVVSRYIGGNPRHDLYLHDGTSTGTRAIDQPFIGYLSNPVVLGNSFYFAFRPVLSDPVTSTTVTAQLWKVDAVAGTVSDVADFYGVGPSYYGLSDLTVGGSKIYFAVANDSGDKTLQSYDPTTGVTAIIGKPGNDYLNPSRLTYFGDALYFTAESVALPNNYGGRSYQPWILGPAPPNSQPSLDGDFNHDGSVDAADYIVWRKTLHTPEKYNEWRANFGKTSGPGSGAAATPAVAAISHRAFAAATLASTTTSTDSAKSVVHSSAAIGAYKATPSSDGHVVETAFSDFGLVTPTLPTVRAARFSSQRTAALSLNSVRRLDYWHDRVSGNRHETVDSELPTADDDNGQCLSSDEGWSDLEEVPLSAVEAAFAVLPSERSVEAKRR